MKGRGIEGDTVAQYLKEFPNYPSRTIARMIFDKHPKMFRDEEHARGMIRYWRGNCGRRNRARANLDKSIVRPNGSQGDCLAALPKGLTSLTDWAPVHITFERGLIINDVHVPYHREDALTLALRHGKKENVDAIIINGDMCDFHSISFYEKNPEQRDYADEVETCKLVLELIRDLFPKAMIVFKEGNHEERLWRYLWGKAPELFSLRNGNGERLLGLESLLDLKSFQIKLVDERKPILCGEHLYLVHGHEWRKPMSNPVNPARGLYMRAKANAICGDLHQTSNHTQTGLAHTVSCWSVGCLSELHPAYMPINSWNLGFATVLLDGGSWSVQNYKIINGRVV